MNTAPAATAATVNTRTVRGTVHRITVGRTFRFDGAERVNGDKGYGKTDCGSITSIRGRLTDEPVNCPKCLAL